MQIAVLADTHIPKRAKTLPQRAWQLIDSADAIIHAGDILTKSFLQELESKAPLYAVRGNNDVELGDLPESLNLEFAGVRVALIHDSGSSKGRPARLRRLFPDSQVVVFGHSHIPLNEMHDGQLIFNPGSATDRRSQPNFSMGMLKLVNGTFEAEILYL
jgi:putative phosphoesterase